jgi:uncharacterized DUF497 family protein
MSGLRFEWDATKDVANRGKHHVSFREAATAFSDEAAGLIADPDHSGAGDRHLLLGMSSSGRVLVVSHCYRAPGDTIRIISARRATSRERAQYLRRWKT